MKTSLFLQCATSFFTSVFCLLLSATAYGQCSAPNNLKISNLKLDSESNIFTATLTWDAVSTANFYIVSVSTDLETFTPQQSDMPQISLNFDSFPLAAIDRITLEVQANCGPETSHPASLKIDLSASPIDFNCLPPTDVTAIIEENILTVNWTPAANATTTELVIQTASGSSFPISQENKSDGTANNFQLLIAAPPSDLDSLSISSICPEKAAVTGPIVTGPIGTIGNVEGIPPATICGTYCNETYQEYSVILSEPTDTIYAMCDYCAEFCENDFCSTSIQPLPASLAKFYPSPFSDFLQLEFSSFNNTSIEVVCYNMAGIMVHQQNFHSTASIHTIATNNWKQGLYIFKITSREGVFFEKVMKGN